MKRRSAARGYTIVELMMSLVVLALGAAGVIAMQRVTLASNQHAKNLAVATSIAEAWSDALVADGVLWNTATDLATDPLWLRNAATTPAEWIRPAYSEARQFGPAFDPLGNPLNADNADFAAYCTDIRLTPVKPVDALTPGGGLIRAEIRVFWKRENFDAVTESTLESNLCDAEDNGPDAVDALPAGYHFVFLTTAVAQQVGG